MIVGILLLSVATRPAPGGAPAATTVPTATPGSTTSMPSTSSTTTAGSTSTTRATTTTKPTPTTTTTAPNPATKLLVANGTSTPNAATFFTTKLQKAGWNTLPPADTTTPVSASTVYYASGKQSAATSLAASLGLKTSAVQPLTTSVPVSGTTGADLVLVLGPDLASQASTTTSST